MSRREAAAALCELKAARDTLEHSGGFVGPDYSDKAGSFALHSKPAIQIDEPYLLTFFALLRDVVEEMAGAAIRSLPSRAEVTLPTQGRALG